MRKIKLHWWILAGMAVGVILGTALNRAYPEAAQVQETALYGALDGIARLFMDLLKMIVIPLVFFSLVSGLAGMGELRRLGRLGLKTAGWYVTTSLLAILTGLALVNLIRPGVGRRIDVPLGAQEVHPPESFWDVLVNMVPENVVAAAAGFDLFGVIFFSVLFGIFLLAVEEKHRRPVLGFIEGGSQIMMKMTRFIIALAPVGIAALIGRLVATTGPEVFLNLVAYLVTVLLALAVHFLATLPLLFWLLTSHNPLRYLKAMSPALLTAFSTASSSGTLAITMERAEKGAGVSNRVASFVLPLGATVNMDGTALYECVTVLFIAQIHSSLDPAFALGLSQQLLIVFLALTVSIGAAGIPHAGLVMMVIILRAVNLPIEYAAIIWTVDRVLDMCRTATNVWSDSTGAAVIAHTEGEIDRGVLFKG